MSSSSLSSSSQLGRCAVEMHVHSHIFIIMSFVVYWSSYLYSLELMIFWSVLETVVFGRLKTVAVIVAIPSCNDNQNRTCF